MGSLVFIGLLLIGLLPAIILIILFIYKIFNDLRMKRFEKKGCSVLTRQKLGDIFDQFPFSRSLRIFKSAICDHSSVDGIRYYSKYPFGIKLISAHDNHRKSLIAYKIGQRISQEKLGCLEIGLCKDILISLTDPQETYYTQLIAWNCLSILVMCQKKTLIREIGINYLKDSVSDDFLMGIGVIKFIFNLIGDKELKEQAGLLFNGLIGHIFEKAGQPLVALACFKLLKSPYLKESQKRYFIELIPLHPKLDDFLKQVNPLSFGFTQEELSEGLKNLGFQSYPYSKNSTEGEIVQLLVKDFLEEIYVPASYMLHSFSWDEKRTQLYNFLWV